MRLSTHRFLHPFLKLAIALAVAMLLSLPQSTFAQDHVVPPTDLQKALQTSTETRQKEINQIDQFLSSKEAQGALDSAHIDLQQVKSATRMLSDSDLARIAARTQQIQHDFAAGASNRDLLWLIVLGVVIIILILVLR